MKPLPDPIKKIGRGAIVGLAGTLLASLLWLSGLLETFEAKTWDWRQQLLAKAGINSDQVALIFLDQNSLDWAKDENELSWPWPREVYTYIINFCQRAGAKALTFDVLYTEPSTYGVYDDEGLGQAVKDFGRFTGTVFLGSETGSSLEWPDGFPEPGISISGLEAWVETAGMEGIVFPRASFPIPELQNSYNRE